MIFLSLLLHVNILPFFFFFWYNDSNTWFGFLFMSNDPALTPLTQSFLQVTEYKVALEYFLLLFSLKICSDKATNSFAEVHQTKPTKPKSIQQLKSVLCASRKRNDVESFCYQFCLQKSATASVSVLAVFRTWKTSLHKNQLHATSWQGVVRLERLFQSTVCKSSCSL